MTITHQEVGICSDNPLACVFWESTKGMALSCWQDLICFIGMGYRQATCAFDALPGGPMCFFCDLGTAGLLLRELEGVGLRGLLLHHWLEVSDCE